MARLIVASAFLVLTAPAQAAPGDDPSLASQLEHARDLNTTAPWRETRDLLDRIEPRLPQASAEERAEFWLIWARNQTLAGNLDRALGQLEDLFDEPLTLHQRVRGYSLAANIAILLRHWEKTFGYLNRGLELAGQLDPADSTDRPFSLAAYVYAKIGEVEQAIDYGKRAVEIAGEQGNARNICISRGRLAFVYKIAEMHDLADRQYREAIETCRTTGDELVTGTIESGMADLLRATGDHEQARALFETALRRLEETDFRYGLGEARFYKARFHWEQGEHEVTKTLLEQALPPLEDDQAWDYVAEAYGVLSEIAAARGDHAQGLIYLRSQLLARERFLDLERARHLAHLQVAFDMRSREQELALLREQRRVAELEAESRRHRERLLWLAYAFAAFLFLVMLLLLLHVLRERRHFRRLAGLDSLTGLSNHTRFFDSARSMVDRVQHDHRPLVLAIGDIDYFKRVNDEFGHIAGDRALREVARVLRESFPEPAHVGRIGGEEFAICLPGAGIEQVLPRLDGVRAALARIDFDCDSEPLSMSFGVAELAPAEPLEKLRKRADEALYRAKHGGRNVVVVADPPH